MSSPPSARSATTHSTSCTRTGRSKSAATSPGRLAGGAIKLLALATRRHRNDFDALYNIIDDVILGGFEQTNDSQRDETIGRLTWSRPNLGGFSVETGVEVAFNKLDSQVDLFDIEEGGEKVRIDLPIDNAVVSEKRGEVFVNAGRSITPKLRADAGLAYEYSRLTVTGDTSAKRSLGFLKPSLTLDWKPGDDWHVLVSVKRTVAQLNFYDFISAAELSADRVNGGNANLLPQRAWEFRTTIEHPILGDGIAKLELGYDHISLLQDRILTEEGFDAPGNLGTGKRKFAAGTLDVPLTKFGIKGGRLKLTSRLEDTVVFDPVSQSDRRFSNFDPEWQWAADYRHDLGKWAYGFNISDRGPFAIYRVNEIDRNRNEGPFATAFVEYRPAPKTTVTFDVDNLLETQAQRERIFSFPSRAVPPSPARVSRAQPASHLRHHAQAGLRLSRNLLLAEGSPQGIGQRFHRILERRPLAQRDLDFDRHARTKFEILTANLGDFANFLAWNDDLGGEIGFASALIGETVGRYPRHAADQIGQRALVQRGESDKCLLADLKVIAIGR